MTGIVLSCPEKKEGQKFICPSFNKTIIRISNLDFASPAFRRLLIPFRPFE